MKLFTFVKGNKKMYCVTQKLAEHWQQHGANLKSVHKFNDMAPYYAFRRRRSCVAYPAPIFWRYFYGK